VVSKVGKPFQDPVIAELMVSSLCRDHKQKYLLQAYVVMPDHMHLIIKPLYENTLTQIMQNLKGSTAYAINKLLKRTGAFWQSENFDHLIRDHINLREKWEYIKENPVRARLVNKTEDYPFSSFYIPSSAG
jgi:REP element-mobilizing transposase RayT